MRRIALACLLVVALVGGLIASSCASTPTTTPSPKPTTAPPSPTATASPTAKPTTSAPAAQVNLTAGSTTSTSGAYAWAVAVARVVNKTAPGINITVAESGGSVDNIKKIKAGTFDLDLAGSWQSDLEMYRGLEVFAGAGWDQIRVLAMRDLIASRTYVRADSGIKVWSDLKGKKLAGGVAGSTSADRVSRSNDFLGTGAIIVPGNLDTAVADIVSGKIDAAHKSGPQGDFDAAFLAGHLTKPFTVIGFSDTDAAKLAVKYPQFMISKTPAGGIKTLPNLGPVWEIYGLAPASISSRTPEDVAYRIVKALYEGRKEIAAAYPSSGLYDPIKDYIKYVPKDAAVPFHAGTVRYAKEIGITVPDYLIPKEYSGK